VTSKSHSVPDETHGDLKADLAGALGNSQFFLVYQPRSICRTTAFAGVEALLRWRHPSRGIISPEALFPTSKQMATLSPSVDGFLKPPARRRRLARPGFSIHRFSQHFNETVWAR